LSLQPLFRSTYLLSVVAAAFSIVFLWISLTASDPADLDFFKDTAQEHRRGGLFFENNSAFPTLDIDQKRLPERSSLEQLSHNEIIDLIYELEANFLSTFALRHPCFSENLDNRVCKMLEPQGDLEGGSQELDGIEPGGLWATPGIQPESVSSSNWATVAAMISAIVAALALGYSIFRDVLESRQASRLQALQIEALQINLENLKKGAES